jgi:tetratricopeptide (TPR) repeat protein
LTAFVRVAYVLHMCTRWRIAGLLAVAFAAAPRASAQTARERIALADRAYTERQAKTALDEYRLALSLEPKNYEALCKASRTAVDVAEGLDRGSEHDALQAEAQRDAETAIAVKPHDADGHFALARALGRKALSLGVMDRIRYAKMIRLEALEALRYDSLNAGALHVLGSWNAEVMRVNGLERAFAKRFLGAEVFNTASWAEAQRLLEKAVKLDPDRLVHHLDLGVIYADRGNKEKAREQFMLILAAPLRDYNDPMYKRKAADDLRKLGPDKSATVKRP